MCSSLRAHPSSRRTRSRLGRDPRATRPPLFCPSLRRCRAGWRASRRALRLPRRAPAPLQGALRRESHREEGTTDEGATTDEGGATTLGGCSVHLTWKDGMGLCTQRASARSRCRGFPGSRATRDLPVCGAIAQLLLDDCRGTRDDYKTSLAVCRPLPGSIDHQPYVRAAFYDVARP